MAYKDKEQDRAYHRERKQILRANPEFRAMETAWNKKYQASSEVIERNRASARKRTTQRRIWRRALALDRYGGECACCGEARSFFLAIDHIDGGGAAHRRELGTKRLYDWLFEYSWPVGFQVLCHNCNAAKYRFGKCPCRKGV